MLLQTVHTAYLCLLHVQHPSKHLPVIAQGCSSLLLNSTAPHPAFVLYVIPGQTLTPTGDGALLAPLQCFRRVAVSGTAVCIF